jgi:hypothetical protein
LNPFDGAVRNAGVNHAVGKRQCHAQYQHDAANNLCTVAKGTGKRFCVQFTVYEGLR